MDDQSRYDQSRSILKKLDNDFQEAGMPDGVVADAMADHLIATVWEIGAQSGIPASAVRVIIRRMESLLQDMEQRHPQSQRTEEQGNVPGDPVTDDFIPTMVRFVWWFLQSLDQRFVEEYILKGGTSEDAVDGLVQDTCQRVQGNRHEESEFTVTDMGMIMDRIAALHLEVRHGPEAMEIVRGSPTEYKYKLP